MTTSSPPSLGRATSSPLTTPNWSSSSRRITTTGSSTGRCRRSASAPRHRASATTAPHAGPLDVPADVATDCARAVLESGIDVAISASMDVDHGTVQPLQKLFGDATARPVIPIFINSVATPLGPLRRVRALGAAVGTYLATLGKRVLVVGSGGLSHDPPVPTLATAPPAALDRIVHGRADDTRAAAGPAGRGDGRSARIRRRARDRFSRSTPTGTTPSSSCSTPTGSPRSMLGRTAGSSRRRVTRRTKSAPGWPHSRRWPRTDGTRPRQRFYRAAPELIAGFAIRTAVLDSTRSDRPTCRSTTPSTCWWSGPAVAA